MTGITEPETGRTTIEPWLEQLRRQLVAVACRRVPPEAAEDLVQDALALVLQRGIRVGSFDTVDGLPPLVWSLQVMRNVIGNYYQRNRTVARHLEKLTDASETGGSLTPLDALESLDSTRVIAEAIDALAAEHPSCTRYLMRLAQGGSPADLAREERLEPMALYRRLYRCRIKLKAILIRRGVLP